MYADKYQLGTWPASPLLRLYHELQYALSYPNKPTGVLAWILTSFWLVPFYFSLELILGPTNVYRTCDGVIDDETVIEDEPVAGLAEDAADVPLPLSPFEPPPVVRPKPAAHSSGSGNQTVHATTNSLYGDVTQANLAQVARRVEPRLLMVHRDVRQILHSRHWLHQTASWHDTKQRRELASTLVHIVDVLACSAEILQLMLEASPIDTLPEGFFEAPAELVAELIQLLGVLHTALAWVPRCSRESGTAYVYIRHMEKQLLGLLLSDALRAYRRVGTRALSLRREKSSLQRRSLHLQHR